MKLTNSTPFPAALQVGSTTDVEQLGSVACKVSYQWDDDGSIFPLPDEGLWPIARGPESFEGTTLLPDLDFRRQGIDVLVFGPAVAPRNEPVREMRIGVASGRFVRQFDVLGDRRWLKIQKPDQTTEWRMSPPAEFVQMPLGADRAFGGHASAGGAPMPFSMNPAGRGFVAEEAAAENVALPNIERIDARIAHWRDQPVPACLHKPVGGLLLPTHGEASWAAAGDADDPTRLVRTLVRESFQQAPPDWVCPRGALGRTLALKGFEAAGLRQMALPPERAEVGAQGPVLYVEVGALRAAFPLSISAVLVLVAQRTLVITFAASFRYLMRPLDSRRAILQWHGATDFALEAA